MKCPICNEEYQLTDAFCPKCGFEIHIIPTGVSGAVKDFEKTRVERYKETWKSLNNCNASAKKLEIENGKIKCELNDKEQKLKNLANQYEKLDSQLKIVEKERNQLQIQIKEKQADISAHDSSIQKLRAQNRDYLEQIAQLKKEIKEGKNQYDDLFNEMSSAQLEIDRLKSQLRSMAEDKERLESDLKKQENQPSSSNPTDFASTINQNRGEQKGEVVFTDGYHTVKQAIYSGNNEYKTPQSLHTNHSGDLFAIVENNDEFTIYDLCGSLKKANGRFVKGKGEQLSNGDAFSVDSMQIRVDLPEIDINEIMF